MGWIYAVLLTLAVEFIVFIAAGFHDKEFLKMFVYANIFTNLLLNLLLSALYFLKIPFVLYAAVILLELFALFFEYYLFSVIKGKSTRLFVWTLFANLLSFIVGLVVFPGFFF